MHPESSSGDLYVELSGPKKLSDEGPDRKLSKKIFQGESLPLPLLAVALNRDPMLQG